MCNSPLGTISRSNSASHYENYIIITIKVLKNCKSVVVHFGKKSQIFSIGGQLLKTRFLQHFTKLSDLLPSKSMLNWHAFGFEISMNLKDINDEKQDEEWDLLGGIDVVVAKLPRDHLIIGSKREIMVKHFDRRHQWRREREGEGGWGAPGHDAACYREPGQSDPHYKLVVMDATLKNWSSVLPGTWGFLCSTSTLAPPQLWRTILVSRQWEKDIFAFLKNWNFLK